MLADRVVVLRDGENAGDIEGDAIRHDQMVRLMVGRDISQYYALKERWLGEVVMKVNGLYTSKSPSHPRF